MKMDKNLSYDHMLKPGPIVRWGDSKQPSTCPLCHAAFDENLALQAEVVHIAAKFGEDAAIKWFNEKMEADHEQHTGM